jgi:hypothetical protein
MPMIARLIGFTAPPSGEPVSMLDLLAESPTVIRVRTFSESFSLADTPLQSSFTHSPAPVLSLRSLSAWVSSLFASPSMASTTRSKHPASAKFRPQVFSTSRRFTPPPTLRAYFIPVTRQGSSPFKAFSLRAATFSRREVLPPYCSCTVRSPTHAGCHGSTCQLRGLVPRGAAFASARGLDAPPAAAFLGFAA